MGEGGSLINVVIVVSLPQHSSDLWAKTDHDRSGQTRVSSRKFYQGKLIPYNERWHDQIKNRCGFYSKLVREWLKSLGSGGKLSPCPPPAQQTRTDQDRPQDVHVALSRHSKL